MGGRKSSSFFESHIIESKRRQNCAQKQHPAPFERSSGCLQSGTPCISTISSLLLLRFSFIGILYSHFKKDTVTMQDVTNMPQDYPAQSLPPNEIDYDVVIVGAGVAGCSAAYHLMTQQCQEHTSTSLRLLVVDAGPAPGEGLAPRTRSGSATMEVAPCVKMMVQLFAGSCDDFVRHHGKEGAKRYLDATREGLNIQKGIAGRLWETDEERGKRLKELGSYYVGSTERDAIELKREFEILSSLMDDDDGIEWCDADRLSKVEGMSSDFCCGIYFPRDAIIDSSMYAKLLMEHVLEKSEGKAEFWPNKTVQSIAPEAGGEKVCIHLDCDECPTVTAGKVVVATGALCRFQRQHERLNGLIKPCYSYLVHVPTAADAHAHDEDYCSPNFFTWGYTHDWCFTKGKIRISGEDHFSAYKSPKVEERCNRLSKWTLDRYDCGNLYTDEEISSFPKQYGLYSETVDMVPMVGTLLPEQHEQENEERNICYLLGCNAWGQTILSYCASLVPGLLGYQELTGSQRDVLELVSIRRFSRLPPK
jgi:glycine/D-amino acid oxidase-like deaminating enzyme